MFPNSRTRTYYIFLNFVCKDNDFSPHYTTFPHFFLILTFRNIFILSVFAILNDTFAVLNDTFTVLNDTFTVLNDTFTTLNR